MNNIGKSYDSEIEAYTLESPSSEVSKGFASGLYQFTHRQYMDDMEKNALLMAYKIQIY